MTSTLSDTDIAAVKARQRATWASGNYAVIGTTLQLVGEALCEAADVAAGWRVLDVAAGNGNAALAAARRGCDVTATDYVPELLEGARRRAEADGLAVDIREADAAQLPYGDGEFDAVLSTFGVMFVPDPERAAGEMMRVCRPGGVVGLANWTPEGFVGQMLGLVGKYVPPPAGVPSPLLWGTEVRLEELFAVQAEVNVVRRHFVFRYRSAEDFFQTFRTYYGPVRRAWETLDDDDRTAFRQEFIALIDSRNRTTTGTLTVDAEYIECVARRNH